ncbi:hypothetical protein F3J28_08760 [Enterobacter sp. Ap-1006]|uniref:hypothetical protein n=1 Tax=Enterobacter sp. Ap-1006 TaxID=2608345 RepID=UPI00141FD8FD|nr:hypothetical protein [Enterobacter sp. Ap-1006]NIF47856.1 hypothetical protein [Enterobacter sp. Ap-1006]
MAAATIAFTYVIPLYQKQNENTISELNAKIIEQNKFHKKEIDSLKNTIDKQQKNFSALHLNNESLAAENNDYKNRLLTLSTLSTFQHGQPLPMGFSSILPGMRLSDVTKKYNKDMLDIDPQGDAITVKVETGGIEDIIYSTGLDNFPDIITSILVSKYSIENSYNGERVDEDENKQSLLILLQEILGQTEECSAGEYFWNIGDYRYVYYNAKIPYFYRIFFAGVYAPGTSSKCLKLIDSLFIKDK